MLEVRKYKNNPILTPNENNGWEASAVFNGSIARAKDNSYHFVYRGVSHPYLYFDKKLPLSTIGYASTKDGLHLDSRRQFITPECPWESFGCEDPRITEFEGEYYIFYTALEGYPPAPQDIKIGLVRTKDFETIDGKHQITHFNSKAMALFPERVNGKITAVLSVNTDNPPTKMAIIQFDEKEQMWSKPYWDNWLTKIDDNVLQIQKGEKDHVEVGAAPIKTERGWLFIYSLIKNYFAPPPYFGIDAVLLDLKDPRKIIGSTKEPLVGPVEEYELFGHVPNIVFPSGAIVVGKELFIYYGAADTVCAVASLNLNTLLDLLTAKDKTRFYFKTRLTRYEGNPIIAPDPEHTWESKYTFNAAAINEGGKTHILYRAMGDDSTSVLGYAESNDGFEVYGRLDEPVYIPREDFEKKIEPGVFSGCEDPRITKMGDKIYMCYTGFDGRNPTSVALTSISVDDFLNKNWNWEKPLKISYPGRSDKNACLLEEKVKDKYVFFHRVGHVIWIDFVKDLNFGEGRWLGGKVLLWPRPGKWDSHKVGIAGPPIRTDKGWLLIYHGLSAEDDKYRLGAVFLDPKDPSVVLSQLDTPIIEPEMPYEFDGFRPGAVFSCGSVVKDGQLLVYYGAADKTLAVGSIKLDELLSKLAV